MSQSDIYQSPTIFLLKSLDDESIPYVSWKNNHELAVALRGGSDLDIFVPANQRSFFFRLAHGLGWIRLKNPVADYPWVDHFYALDQDFKPHHLHVYFKVVTGESWLKEYILPLDHLFFNNRVFSEDFGVWILNESAQAYVFALRHWLKNGSLFSRLLYSREMDSYQKEWLSCSGYYEHDFEAEFGTITSLVQNSGLDAEQFKQPGVAAAFGFRMSCCPFLRFSWYSLPFRRIFSFFKRAANKWIFKKSKIFPDGGMIISVSGVDGSGKTTMIDETSAFLSTFVTVRRFTLGKPQGVYIETVRKVLTRKNKDKPSNPEHVSKAKNWHPSFAQAFSGAMLAFLRLRMANKALKCAAKGCVALIDRWPTQVFGMMDGPKLNGGENAGLFIRTCVKFERWAYSRIPRADLCIMLKVPLEVLVRRNQDRDKQDKETDADIVERFNKNQESEPLADRIINFDNSGPLSVKRQELFKLIWNEIAGR